PAAGAPEPRASRGRPRSGALRTGARGRWRARSAGGRAATSRSLLSRTRSLRPPRAPARAGLLHEQVTVSRVEIEAVHPLQGPDARERLGAEGCAPLEGVQHDALDQIAEGDLVRGRDRLEDLEDALLDADARLDALDHPAPRGVVCAGGIAFVHHG